MDGVHPFFKGKALGTRLHFGGKTVVAVVSLLRVLARNVVVAKTSYQMLEILSFSDRKSALPLSTEIRVLFQPLSVNSLMHDQPRPKCFGLSIIHGPTVVLIKGFHSIKKCLGH